MRPSPKALRGLLACTLIATCISGCLDADEEPHLLDAEPGGPWGARSLDPGAGDVIPSRDDWLALPLMASAPGAVAAYAFTLPAGSAVPAWYDEDTLVPVVEFTLLQESAPEALALIFVNLDSQQVVTTVTSFSSDSSQGLGASASTPAGSRAMNNDAASDYVDLDGMGDGDRLGIVVAAIGDGPADVGIRFVDEDPRLGEDFTWPSRNVTEFLSRTSGTGWVPPLTGLAQGFELDTFIDYESLLIIPSAMRFVVGDMQVEEAVPELPVAQPANDLQLEAQSDFDSGFSSTLLWSWTSTHAGMLEYDLRARTADPAEGLSVLVPDPIVHSMLAMAIGDGEGPSSVSASMTYAGVPAGLFSKLTILDHVATSASLEELFGTPVEWATYHASLPVAPGEEGAAAGEPLVRVDRSRLVIEGPTSSRVFQGVFPGNTYSGPL